MRAEQQICVVETSLMEDTAMHLHPLDADVSKTPHLKLPNARNKQLKTHSTDTAYNHDTLQCSAGEGEGGRGANSHGGGKPQRAAQHAEVSVGC